MANLQGRIQIEHALCKTGLYGTLWEQQGCVVGLSRFVFTGLFIFTNTWAMAEEALNAKAQPSCAQLVRQLRAMEKAQQSLLTSMVGKNDSMATTLDQYAKNFEIQGHRLQKSDVQSLKRSAQAFRRHGDREMGLVVRFEKSSEELLSKVEACLSAQSPNPAKTVEASSELVQR